MGTTGRHLLARLSRPIVVHPPWCELTTAALSAVIGWRATTGHLPWWWLPAPLLLTWLAVPLSIADLAHHRLPNALTVPAYPALGLATALAATFGKDPAIALRALAGLAIFGGTHALIRILVPTTLGAGDVKLAGSLGAILGALGWPALAAAAVLAATCTLVIAATRGTTSAPHGPGLLLATWLLATFPAGP
ncbi:MAG TPA: A24 family peptidase [Pseudonocardiaceae bacterium]|nr:A24 family peptidase [Pseudonocardiaceae bacterium]